MDSRILPIVSEPYIFPNYPMYILFCIDVEDDVIREYFSGLGVSVKRIRRLISHTSGERFESCLIELDIVKDVVYETSYKINSFECYMVRRIVDGRILYLKSGYYVSCGFELSKIDNDVPYDRVELYSM